MIEGVRLLLDGALASPWLLLVIVGLAAVDALLPVVPSEALIIAAGVGAAAGGQDLVAVVAAAAAGALVGELGSYALGREFGVAVRRRLAPGTRHGSRRDAAAGARRGLNRTLARTPLVAAAGTRESGPECARVGV